MRLTLLLKLLLLLLVSVSGVQVVLTKPAALTALSLLLLVMVSADLKVQVVLTRPTASFELLSVLPTLVLWVRVMSEVMVWAVSKLRGCSSCQKEGGSCAASTHFESA